ncbi:MAG: GMC family oxidoreductase [Planctomycetes bacterium]|nr:GMC family oxidoreductase [Planctomycetota bacterium]
MQHYDVILIGTGAGGGTLLHKLAPSGKRILVLERGDHLPREKQNWDPASVFLDNRYKANDEWLDRDGQPFHPGTHYCVGGNTKVYGAALLRFRERDFQRQPHFGGVSPEWPVQYDEFEPYYTAAEWLYQVRGERGVDPTEPWASKPYAFPRVEHEPRIQQLHDDCERLGLRPFHVPLGIQLDDKRRHQSPCIRCATCDGFPCLVHAKSDAETLCVLPALQRPNVTLLTGAKVERLRTNARGTAVTSVVVERAGQQEEYAADLVVVACGAVNSAALLLRSANERHSKGLGNSSGVVGRHYMCHNNSVLLVISRHPNPTVFQKTIALNDFYFGAPDAELPLGHISMVGKSDKVVLKAGAPKFAPGFVLDRMAKHAIDFWLTSEDLPDPDNRVRLDGNGRIVLDYRPNNLEAHQRLQRQLKSMLGRIGCEDHSWFEHNLYLGKKIPLAGVAHQCGTVRFGTDPSTSALDVNCKSHDLDNLYVVDGSFFVSSSAVNPALTIMANALRVGDHLLQRLGASATATVGATP